MREGPALAEALLDALPQTQCRRCGYADCRSYAVAMAQGAADVDRCPPGGAEGVQRLARITGTPSRPLDPACGQEAPRTRAVIDESACIGCALCLAACPADAIVGANKRTHTVIADLCTGCELCLPVCPVDCISLIETSEGRTGWSAWSAPLAQIARDRYESHRRRMGADDAVSQGNAAEATAARREAVAAAVTRAHAAAQGAHR